MAEVEEETMSEPMPDYTTHTAYLFNKAEPNEDIKMSTDKKEVGAFRMKQAQIFCEVLINCLSEGANMCTDTARSVIKTSNQVYNSIRKYLMDDSKEVKPVTYFFMGRSKTASPKQQMEFVCEASVTSGLNLNNMDHKGFISTTFVLWLTQTQEVNEMLWPKSRKEITVDGTTRIVYNLKDCGIDVQRYWACLQFVDAPPGMQGGLGRNVGPTIAAYNALCQTDGRYKDKAWKKVLTNLRHIPALCGIIEQNYTFLTVDPNGVPNDRVKECMTLIAQSEIAWGSRQAHKITPTPALINRIIQKNTTLRNAARRYNKPYIAMIHPSVNYTIVKYSGREAWEQLNENINYEFHREVKPTAAETKWLAHIETMAAASITRGNMLHAPYIASGWDLSVLKNRPGEARRGVLKTGNEAASLTFSPQFKRWCKISTAAPSGMRGQDDQIGGVNIFSGKHLATVNTGFKRKISGQPVSKGMSIQEYQRRVYKQFTEVSKGQTVWGTTDWKSFADDPKNDVKLPLISVKKFLGWTCDWDNLRVEGDQDSLTWSLLGGDDAMDEDDLL